MSAAASWYHCSVKPVSRSSGRSVVAAAAYRLGERMHDLTHDVLHDYTRKRGIDGTFTLAPEGSPEWALDPAQLWNAAEAAETRKNSTLAREVELALPAFLSPEERQAIAEQFAAELVERYGVAVSVAMHRPGKNGDDRNYHAHILFTTREMTPEGLGRKTRILDDRKTGPGEVVKLRELAADLINDALKAANSDIRVDHRSFKERGIEREPTTHLGPAAAEMERRDAGSGRGDYNRHVEEYNAMLAERARLDAEIQQAKAELASPPRSRQDAQDRLDAAASQHMRAQAALRQDDTPSRTDGLTRWQRSIRDIAITARELLMDISEKLRQQWQRTLSNSRGPEPWTHRTERGPHRGIER